MNDRQLLEAAAKAAGLTVLRSRLDDPMWRDLLLDARPAFPQTLGWNPLADDGDALRLAVKLGIQIGDFHQYGRALAYHGATRGSGEFWEIGDPYVATRRAIVRAAAAMAGEKE